MKHLLLMMLCLFILQQSFAQDYVPGLIVVKFKEGNSSARMTPSQEYLTIDQLKNDASIKEVTNIGKPAPNNFRKPGQSTLHGIYKLEIDAERSEVEYINYLKSFDNIAYAEQYPNVKPLYVPNDPEAQFGKKQFHLAQINVYDAWNVTQGSEDIVIGVIDTGADLDHEDLVDNLYVNEADPIDGIDNDNDGYIDNYYGWDFADNDNSPEADGSTHGTGVSGIAAAATDNGKGIAGVGFNTRFMPIKIFETDTEFARNSYEAIIYAADQGCDVINLSWGGTGRYSQFAQDIINYAVVEKDVVVVAAAGNTNAELDFFPASYDHVLSVGYVNADDSRNTQSTYSDFIDLVAPGVGVHTTENDDTYNKDSGSSYAAPMVAGAAALIRSVFGEWSAQQVMEQLRVSSDDISAIGNNSDFEYKLGKGRLNVFKALADFDTPSIRITDVVYSNGQEEAAYFGDTLDITLGFTNFLEATENVNVKLTSSNPYVTILQSDFTIGSLATQETITNSSQTFQVVLSKNLPEDETLNFRVLFEGEYYNDYQSFQIQSSAKIRLFEYNGWKFGFTATGNLGRSYATPFPNFSVQFNDDSLIDHMGIVLYAGEDSLRRNTLISPEVFQYTEDFESFRSLKRYQDITADFDVRSTFKEQDSIPNPLGIYIEQRFLGWNDQSDLLLHQYRLQNRSGVDYDSVYFALFTDYAISDKRGNQLAYDSALQLSYAYNEAEDQYVGLSLIGAEDSVFYAFDLSSAHAHTSDMQNDSLTQNVIQNAFKNPFSKREAGQLSEGNNVGSLHGIMIPRFRADTTQSIALALLRASSLSELKALVEQARIKDSLTHLRPPFRSQLLICQDDTPVIEARDGFTMKVYASPTVDTTLYEGKAFEPGSMSKDTVFYITSIDSIGIASVRERQLISITRPEADMLLPDFPLLLDPESTNSFPFTDKSVDAVAWNWKFSHGLTTTKQNPNVVIEAQGNYDVELIVENAQACSDTVKYSFTAVMRAAKPQIADVEICKNSTLSLFDADIAEITVYADSLMTEQLYKGEEFTAENLKTDSTFYIRNEMGNYPSELIAVEVGIIPIEAEIEVQLAMGKEKMQGVAKSNSSYAKRLIWMLGADTLGTKQEVYFNLEDIRADELKLIAISESGCRDTAVFEREASEKPQFEDYFICESEGINLSATNTDSVYYFTDRELTNFLGKGSNITIPLVSDSMQIFAVNVENIKPSEAVKVPLYVSSVSADFQLSHDTINLAFEEEVVMESGSATASEWTWKLDDTEIGSSQKLSHSLSKSGVFTVALKVKDTLGCSQMLSKQLVVFNDPLLGNKRELKSYFSIYPNPADKRVHLTGKNQFEFDSYKIVDVNGAELIKGDNDKPIIQTEIIDVSKLEPGPYYLIIRKGMQEASFLFVIRR